MVYESLIDVPHNVKEGIDWLVALKGDDGDEHLAALGEAIHKYLSYNFKNNPELAKKLPSLEHVKLISMGFMWNKELRGLWPAKDVLGNFVKAMDKKPSYFVNAMGSNPAKITKNLTKFFGGCEKFLDEIKHPATYESAYSSKATWDASCSEIPEACAAVFVGIAPMLYLGLESMRDASASQSSCWWPFGKKKAKVNFGEVVRAVGYDDLDCLGGAGSASALKAVKNLNPNVVDIVHDLCGFDAVYESENPESVPAEKSAEPVADGSSVEGEGEQSVIPEAEPTFEGEGEQSVIPEAEPSVDGEGEQSVIPEAEPTFEGEGEQSVIPEAEPSVEPAGEEPVIPEAEPSVEPVKPEVDDIEKPVKVAKAAKVARSVKAAKKAAKKVSRKARQKKEKKQQESAEH
ncbi:hypothetical protein BBBOND_0203150 [Babesia bigemina]|uniref:Uncharacterized protein n=2 Tax=Babesia bigemina TaxID=5866 RepID=A0A061D3J8_BABBI|nr:hypothetical protein BBBOND_0203150 [Babesia bigemina]CDR95158.1 hypothetical protein BBBOND_0203150 [Babesia bigemina]|eukprot:XP_012767344.1 hypothetical protein BBBOND_0203150 [Babesia bigemina]